MSLVLHNLLKSLFDSSTVVSSELIITLKVFMFLEWQVINLQSINCAHWVNNESNIRRNLGVLWVENHLVAMIATFSCSHTICPVISKTFAKNLSPWKWEIFSNEGVFSRLQICIWQTSTQPLVPKEKKASWRYGWWSKEDTHTAHLLWWVVGKFVA
jgi:hypothetical protein